MKYLIQINTVLLFLFLSTVPASAQYLYGKAAIGNNNPVSINGNLTLKSNSELYLHHNTLNLTGNCESENGSEIHISVNSDRVGFLNIDGTANGIAEIIPDFSFDWDGSRIDFVKAKQDGSVTDAFRTEDIPVDDGVEQLRYEQQSMSLIWYIEKTEPDKPDSCHCLPLIVQLANHTLVANNNSETNGGYNFARYYWYKNGMLIKEDSHDDYGGSYYTGGTDLDENAEYRVKVIDDSGNSYLSCPYRYIPMTMPINVTAYPNPVPRNAKGYVRVETQDISLLADAAVEIYNVLGQSFGKTNVNGQTLVTLDFPASSGVYILRFTAKDYVKNIKIMVE